MDGSNQPKPAGSDLMVAVAAVMCIALGASVTYWLTHGQPQNGGAGPVAVREGKALNGPKEATVPAPAQPAAAAKPAAEPEMPKSAEGDFMPVTFATLSSYYYEVPGLEEPAATKTPATATPQDQIPEPIKKLNEKKIAVQGFMVPTDLKNGKSQNFLLVKDQSLCCFGRMPRMNEWISVRTKPGKGARVVQDQPITVFGSLSVGEQKDPTGEVLSIYRIEADDVAGPLDL